MGEREKLFVESWIAAYNKGYKYSYIAEKTGLSIQQIASKAQTLKKAGVELPKLKRGATRVNKAEVKELNNLINKEVK